VFRSLARRSFLRLARSSSVPVARQCSASSAPCSGTSAAPHSPLPSHGNVPAATQECSCHRTFLFLPIARQSSCHHTGMFLPPHFPVPANSTAVLLSKSRKSSAHHYGRVLFLGTAMLFPLSRRCSLYRHSVAQPKRTEVVKKSSAPLRKHRPTPVRTACPSWKTLHASSENPPRFFGKPFTLLWEPLSRFFGSPFHASSGTLHASSGILHASSEILKDYAGNRFGLFRKPICVI